MMKINKSLKNLVQERNSVRSLYKNRERNSNVWEVLPIYLAAPCPLILASGRYTETKRNFKK